MPVWAKGNGDETCILTLGLAFIPPFLTSLLHLAKEFILKLQGRIDKLAVDRIRARHGKHWACIQILRNQVDR